MGRPPKNSTIDVIDFTQEPYEPNDTKERIVAKYGVDSELQHIYLKRYDKSGILKGLRKYPELPDEDSIKNEFGGGNFELWVTFRDPNTPSGRNLAKIPIMIEGTSITPDYAGTETKSAAPVISEDEQEDRMLNKMAKWKSIFGGDQGGGRIDLLMKQMEMQQAQILAFINKKDDSSSSKLQELLLTKAFENNRSDIDIILKARKLFDQGGPQTADEYGWLKAMAPAIVPLLAKALGPKAPAGVNGMITQGAAANPQGGDPLVDAINGMAQAINSMHSEIQQIKAEVKDIREGIEPIPEDDQDPENSAAGNTADENIINLNVGGEVDPLEAIAEQIKAATPGEQDQLLKQWVESTGAQQTFEFCLKYKLVKDKAEFNERLLKLELPALP